jgi:hypothetical protein
MILLSTHELLEFSDLGPKAVGHRRVLRVGVHPDVCGPKGATHSSNGPQGVAQSSITARVKIDAKPASTTGERREIQLSDAMCAYAKIFGAPNCAWI